MAGTPAFADEWDRAEAPGVHVGFVATTDALLSVACFAPDSGNDSGIALRVRGANEGLVRISVDEGPVRVFEIKDGTFEVTDATRATFFATLLAELRTGSRAVIEIGDARASVSLAGSARAIGACPTRF